MGLSGCEVRWGCWCGWDRVVVRVWEVDLVGGIGCFKGMGVIDRLCGVECWDGRVKLL